MRIELIGKSKRNSDGILESNGSVIIETISIEELDVIAPLILNILKEASGSDDSLFAYINGSKSIENFLDE